MLKEPACLTFTSRATLCCLHVLYNCIYIYDVCGCSLSVFLSALLTLHYPAGHQQMGPSYEPGPAQGLYMLKGSSFLTTPLCSGVRLWVFMKHFLIVTGAIYLNMNRNRDK